MSALPLPVDPASFNGAVLVATCPSSGKRCIVVSFDRECADMDEGYFVPLSDVGPCVASYIRRTKCAVARAALLPDRAGTYTPHPHDYCWWFVDAAGQSSVRPLRAHRLLACLAAVQTPSLEIRTNEPETWANWRSHAVCRGTDQRVLLFDRHSESVELGPPLAECTDQHGAVVCCAQRSVHQLLVSYASSSNDAFVAVQRFADTEAVTVHPVPASTVLAWLLRHFTA